MQWCTLQRLFSCNSHSLREFPLFRKSTQVLRKCHFWKKIIQIRNTTRLIPLVLKFFFFYTRLNINLVNPMLSVSSTETQNTQKDVSFVTSMLQFVIQFVGRKILQMWTGLCTQNYYKKMSVFLQRILHQKNLFGVSLSNSWLQKLCPNTVKLP